MSPRTKKLVVVVFIILLVFQGGKMMSSSLLEEPRKKLKREIAKVEKRIEGHDEKIFKGLEAQDLLPDWEIQSLPKITDTASKDYKNWLLVMVKRSGLENVNVEANRSVTTKKGVYNALSFSLRGKGTWEQLTAFLYEFYQTNMAHRIESLSINPIRSTGQVDVSMSIQALSVVGADREQLNMGPSDRLASKDVQEYRPIISRNLFSIGGEFDPVNQTHLSAILYSSRDGEPEAWFHLRATDEKLELRRGETLEVGDFSGKIVDIDKTDVVIESGDSRWLLSIGENLDQAFALPPQL